MLYYHKERNSLAFYWTTGRSDLPENEVDEAAAKEAAYSLEDFTSDRNLGTDVLSWWQHEWIQQVDNNEWWNWP
jgi:hypothetical protein